MEYDEWDDDEVEMDNPRDEYEEKHTPPEHIRRQRKHKEKESGSEIHEKEIRVREVSEGADHEVVVRANIELVGNKGEITVKKRFCMKPKNNGEDDMIVVKTRYIDEEKNTFGRSENEVDLDEQSISPDDPDIEIKNWVGDYVAETNWGLTYQKLSELAH